jgi:hypothetical protein
VEKMTAEIIEKALGEYLTSAAGGVPIILGSSADNQTAPSVRVICQTCSIPEGFPANAQERAAQVSVACVVSADATGAPAALKTLSEAITNALRTAQGQIIEQEWQTLVHSMFLADQGTDNDERLLVYFATYTAFFAFDQT